MSVVSQEDWELLNAYHDGQLSLDEEAALEQRLSDGPHLMDALADIQKVSAALQVLRPQRLSTDEPAALSAPRSHKIAALAACIVIGLGLGGGGAWFWAKQPSSSPMDLHSAFVSMQVDVLDPRIQNALYNAKIPSLTQANLFFVRKKQLPEGMQVLHYAGYNNCGLTVIVSQKLHMSIKTLPELILSSWQQADTYYTVMATGMDANRFAAISTFLKAHYSQNSASETTMAMQDATKEATPCMFG